MPKASPREFRDDVVAVAQRREPGVTIKQIAEDFGISETCLQNWLRQAEVEAGRKPGVSSSESAELRELRVVAPVVVDGQAAVLCCAASARASAGVRLPSEACGRSVL